LERFWKYIAKLED